MRLSQATTITPERVQNAGEILEKLISEYEINKSVDRKTIDTLKRIRNDFAKGCIAVGIFGLLG